jgi:signal transduction histidine kinase
VARPIGEQAQMQDDDRMSSGPSAPPAPSPDAAQHAHAGPSGPTQRPTTPVRRWVAIALRAPVAGRTWRDYLYLLVAGPLALASFIALALAMYTGIVLSLVLVGIPLIALIVLTAREFGVVPRALARDLLGRHVEAPRRRRPKRHGFFAWLRASLGDLDGWRAIAYVVVSLPVKVVGAWAVWTGLALAIVLFTYPAWWQLFDPTNTDEQGVVYESGLQFGDSYMDTWPEALGVSALGLAALFVLPWVARAITTIDGLLVHGLLGPTKIAERVDDLEETRAYAVDDSAATLRRIERDLHDGTQARLVALAMHLDMAKVSLDESAGPADSADRDGVARARALLDEAHRNATEAITELREVTRSIHPPALDRGLDEALATLAARSGVPAEVHTALTVRPSPAIETIAYFCVAELLTNVAKHSGARAAMIEVRDVDDRLRVRVGDDGRGGARMVHGGGLAGLAERVRTVDGTLAVSSPDGGPTVVTLDLPLGV